jgi:hypothetical protein
MAMPVTIKVPTTRVPMSKKPRRGNQPMLNRAPSPSSVSAMPWRKAIASTTSVAMMAT